MNRHSLFRLFAALVLAALSLCGCGKPAQSSKSDTTTHVHIRIENASSNALDWVELECGGRRESVGILIAGSSDVHLNERWLYATNATLKFVDETNRQPYAIHLDLSAINETLRKKKVEEVTFRILSYERAEVICE